ncbi:MAG: type II toxin-antitoxin system VapC family toxin [Thermoplasmata archaeon]
MGVVVDSNVIVDVLSGDLNALAKVRDAEARYGPPFVSSIVIFESLVGVLFRGSVSRMRTLESMFAQYPVLPVDAMDARKAAEIRVEMLRAGQPVSIPDTLIAGQALAGGHVLLTRDGGLATASRMIGLQVETY